MHRDGVEGLRFDKISAHQPTRLTFRLSDPVSLGPKRIWI
jgi:hypothetical protein